jgi:hypothetical protein
MATLSNISVEEFKAQTGAGRIDIVRNPKTQKLFASANGKNYRVQADIDLAKPIDFLMEEGKTIDDGCFVNSNTENLVGSL